MSFRALLLLVVSASLASVPLACGTDSAAGDGDGNGSKTDGGTGSGLGDGGDDLLGGTGDDGGTSGPRDVGFNTDAACASSSSSATLVTKPVDVIVLVDNSCSMSEETQNTSNNLTEFANVMGASNIDYHVVMISSKGKHTSSYPFQVCVKPPLAGDSNCGDGARYRAIDYEVKSTNALSLIISLYNTTTPSLDWKSFLRPDAQKNFLIISDDNSSLSATSFENQLFALQPSGMFTGYKMNAIYGYNSLSECPTLATVGTVYTTLVTKTGGARARICDTDWKAIFTQLAQSVVAGTKVSCDFAVPAPPPGKSLSTSKVSVVYTPGNGGAPVQVNKVDSSGQCTSSAGFYFDNNTKPTRIYLCPGVCSQVQNDSKAKIDVMFACGGGGPQ